MKKSNSSSIFIVLMLASTLFISCSNKLIGTWTVDKYKVEVPGKQPVEQENIGTMKFRKKGEGAKDLNYKDFLGNNKKDNSVFGWHATGFYIGIESPASEFSQTWASFFNKKKQQKWKATDEKGVVRIIEMTKK